VRRRALGFAAAAAAVAFPLLPLQADAGLALTMLGLTLLAVRARETAGAQATLAAGLLIASWLVPLGYSQLTLAIALAGWWFAPRVIPSLPKAQPWLALGTMTRAAKLWTAAIVVSAAAALIAWLEIAKPELASLRAQFVPRGMALPLVIVGMLVFASWNAMVEELCYRGFFMHALDETLGEGAASLLLQAAAFGALHVNGFPRGPSGIALAAIYGFALGILRRMTRGMFAPWLAHVTADVTIGALLLWRVS
jgi:membrane protease YdiL (CAAX protease family)